MTNDEKILNELEKVTLRLEKIEMQQQLLFEKLGKHIDFIDETYEGLKNPIKAATRFLGR